MRLSALLIVVAAACAAPLFAQDVAQADPGADIEIHSWQEILDQALKGADAAAADVTTFAISHGQHPLDEVAATLANLHQDVAAVAANLTDGNAVPEARMRAVCERARAVRDCLNQVKEAEDDRDTAASMQATAPELAWWDQRLAALAARLPRVDLTENINDADGEQAEAACHHLIVRVHAQVREVMLAQRALAAKAATDANDAADADANAPETADATGATVASATGADAAPHQPQLRTYTLVAGDSLASISRHFFGTTRRWREIEQANPGFDQFKPGQVITIPTDAKATMDPASATASATAAPIPDIANQSLAAFDTAAAAWLGRLQAWRAGTGERPGDFAAQRYEEALRLGQAANELDHQRDQTDADHDLAGLAELAAFDRIITHEASADRDLALLTLAREDGDPALLAAQAACKDSDDVISGAREALDQAKERAVIVHHIQDVCAQEPNLGGGTISGRLRDLLLRADNAVRAATDAVTTGAMVARIQALGELAKAGLQLEALRAETDDDLEMAKVEQLFAAGSATAAATATGAAAAGADARLLACRERAKDLAESREKALDLALAKQDVETRLALLNLKQDALGTSVDDANATSDRARGLFMSDVQALHQAAEAAAAPQVQKGHDDALQVPTADPKDGL
jgi:hypothetical protein